MTGATLKSRVNELLDLVGLNKARDRRLGTYSKGMLQRIGLAQALIHDPRLVVLDEPTAGVDPAGSRENSHLIMDLSAAESPFCSRRNLLAQRRKFATASGFWPMACWFVKAVYRN